MALDNLISVSFTAEELAAMDSAMEALEDIIAGKLLTSRPSNGNSMAGWPTTRKFGWKKCSATYMVRTGIAKIQTGSIITEVLLFVIIKYLYPILEEIISLKITNKQNLFGILTGVMRKKSDGLLPGIVFHALNNTLVLLFLFARKDFVATRINI